MSAPTSRRLQRSLGQRALDGLAADFLHRPGVDRSSMFGSNALRTHGKIFAFVGAAGELVVKVPADRAAELVTAAVAARIRIGRNPAREWIGLPPSDTGDGTDLWRDLLDEAYRYVSSLHDG